MTDSNSSGRSFGEVQDTSDNVQDSETTTEEVVDSNTQDTEGDTGTEEIVPGDTKPSETDETSETIENTTTTVSEEPKLTEKGTKLDPNPQSAVHQQLANERKVREQYEQVLSNPQMLAQYMRQKFPTAVEEPKETEPKTDVKEFKPEDFETLDDVASVMNSLQKGFAEKSQNYEKEITELRNIVSGISNTSRQQQVAGLIERDVQSVQKLPEFNPDSPEYVEGLEERITQKYHELDYDQNTGFYRGQYSLAKIAQETLDNIALGKKAGSLKAQTVVRNKSEGKVKVSPKVDVEVSDESLSPEDSIAAGIAKTWGKRS